MPAASLMRKFFGSAEAGGLYDRIKAHDPADRSCDYLFSR